MIKCKKRRMEGLGNGEGKEETKSRMQRERKRKKEKERGKRITSHFFGMDTDIKYINLLH